MMRSYWWIREIDWRISAGVILFIQLAAWRNGEKRRLFPVRLTLSLGALCGASWCMRFVLEEWVQPGLAAAAGYSLYLLAMTFLFVACDRFCYRSQMNETIFKSIVALTVYRISWDLVKLVSAIPVGEDAVWTNGSPFQSVLSYACYFLVGGVVYEFFRRLVRRRVAYPPWMPCLLPVALVSQMLLEFVFQLFNNGENELLFYLTAFLYSLVILVLMMAFVVLTTLQEENFSMQNFIRSKQQYYEISREGILSLQIKCHDLKHQIAMLRSAEGKRQLDQYIDSLADTIDEYNTVISSGNKNVDVVLTEKNIICSMNRIRFTYMVDGRLFSFLTDMEIYALFGNAMDNAIEGMEKADCPEKKFISLRANRRGPLVILVVENYCDRELKFSNGMPVTTKEEARHHGFGLRSIMSIAKDHGGWAVVEARNNIFKLTVTMEPGKELE